MEGLPNDIVCLILEELSESGTPSDSTPVQPLLRVSRRWHELALPYVYRRVIIHSNNCVGRFLSRVVSRPDLAAYVRCLILGWNWHCWSGAACPVNSDVVVEHLQALEAAIVADEGSREDFRRRLRTDQDAQVLALLHFLPGLKVLDTYPFGDITMPSSFVSSFYKDAFDGIGRDQPPGSLPAALRSVRYWKASFPYTRLGLDVRDALPAFALPCMTHLRLDLLRPRDRIEDDMKRLASLCGTSALKSLYLSRSQVEPSVLGGLLGIPVNLDEFVYENTDGSPRLRPPKDTGRGLGEALARVRHSLSRLQLHVTTDLLDAPGTIGSLAEYARLESLSIDIWLLLDARVDHALETSARLVDLLPASLRRLNLEFGYRRNLAPAFLPAVLHLLQHAPDRLPRLEHVTVDVPDTRPEYGQLLDGACQQSDIRLDIIHADERWRPSPGRLRRDPSPKLKSMTYAEMIASIYPRWFIESMGQEATRPEERKKRGRVSQFMSTIRKGFRGGGSTRTTSLP